MEQACDHDERAGVALYARFFPRYNRLMAESGFAESAERIRELWTRGEHDAAIRAVPDALIDTTGVVGTPGACRERIEAYRQSGQAILRPASDGPCPLSPRGVCFRLSPRDGEWAGGRRARSDRVFHPLGT